MDESVESLYERMGGGESIAKLLRHFYADVRQHKVIGPTFNEHIKDWTVHLEIISSFWARMTGGPSKYAGRMPVKHLSLGLHENHFEAWLQLWEFNCRSYLQKPEAQELISLAQDIGRRRKGILSANRFPTTLINPYISRGGK